ncbi:MAG: VWA-like domain-containing protein [candidate division WOR-3 bacterium]|nr:VWA-like domain-containing protein [candidate division WOR-3 bacterium]
MESKNNILEDKLLMLLIKARASLLKNYPFFGYWALQGEIILQDSLPLHAPAATDGKNYFFSKKRIIEYKDELELLFIHEVLHNQLAHIERGKNKIWSIWILAVDFVINSIMVDELKLPLLKYALYDKEFSGLSAETIYEMILKDLPEELVNGLMLEEYITNILGEKVPDSKDYQKIVDEIWDRAESEIREVLDQMGFFKHSSVCGSLPDKSTLNPELKRQMQEAIKEMIIKAAIFAKNQSHGTVPLGLERFIEKLVKPKLNLREIIDLFAYTVGKGMDDYSFSRRRKRETDLLLPGVVGMTRHIVVGIDTSGSIDDGTLRRFLSEVSNLSGSNTKITLVPVDADVYDAIEISEYDDLYEKLTETHSLKGGGGTDFSSFFDYIANFPEPVNGVIFFTDGEADYPDKSQEPNYPVLWIITEERNLNSPPFGERYYLSPD